jgi:uncharacterized membrane protein
MSEPAAAPAARRGGPRWLLLGSLALNLFFIGVAVAIAVRGPHERHWDPDVFVRIERIAETLPPADAKLLDTATKAKQQAIDQAQTAYYDSRVDIRETLRQDPFKAADLRAAMAKMRAARQHFDEAVQGVFADAAAEMSPAGRQALADWHLRRPKKRDRH